MKDDINQEITFRKLSVFMMFMAKGNIARTAEAMKLSSVSVHRALHTLEEGVGCPLFVHKGRNLLPLQAAWTLLEYCQDVISLMNRGLEATRKVAGVGQGRLRIGTLYSLTLETVPRIIMGMKLRRPELELDLTMGSNQMLLDMLEDDALDAILIATNEGEFNNTAFDVVPLFEDDIFLAAPATERLDASRLADLRDYADRKFVSLAEGFATYAGFREAFHIAGFEPEIVTRVNDIFSMISLVQAGVGFALLPGRMKKVYEKDVQLLKLAEPYQMRQLISIVYSHHRERDADLLALAAEGRMYAAVLIAKPLRQMAGDVHAAALQRNGLPAPARLAGQAGEYPAGGISMAKRASRSSAATIASCQWTGRAMFIARSSAIRCGSHSTRAVEPLK